MADDTLKTTNYLTRVAPQCITDLLIQVFPDDEDESTLCAFTLGECLSSWIECYGCLDGSLQFPANEKSALERAALHLERHAKMIRDALTAPRNASPRAQQRTPGDFTWFPGLSK